MKVKILYFAALREALGCSGEETTLPPTVTTVGELRALLLARGEPWQALGSKRIRAALNQRMAGADAALQAGDEVAFFPPVTGG
jgi:molybdopterin synthase sulfur carrier subunit